MFVISFYLYQFSYVDLFKKLKSQGSKKQSTSNVKANGQNAKKRRETPPGIWLSNISICSLDNVYFICR